MDSEEIKATCRLCNSEFSARGIGRHLSACLKKKISGTDKEQKTKRYCFFSIRDRYNPDYFLFLLVSYDSVLKDLDDYFRGIWLECCGHMSEFSYGKRQREIPMTTRLGAIAEKGLTISYQYDFGSTTHLDIKFVDTPALSFDDKTTIKLLSRNSQPVILCDECEKIPAIRICTECQWDDAGWLCEKCAKKHKCDEDMFLPVVNSPRTGVCGYRGGEEPSEGLEKGPSRPLPKRFQELLSAWKRGEK